MNDKRIIETFKTAKRQAKWKEKPRMPTSSEAAELRAQVLAALNNKTSLRRNSQPVSDKPKSEARLIFESNLDTIIERTTATPPPPIVCPDYDVEKGETKPASVADDVPLWELLRQTRALIVKASRK